MKFQDYIQSLSSFKLKKISDNEYILIDGKKTLTLTPDNMYSEQEIHKILTKDDFHPCDLSFQKQIKDKKSSIDDYLKPRDMTFDPFKAKDDQDGPVFLVGQDDLHPSIGRFPRKPKGSIFKPEDLFCDINKSDIYPNKKTDPDNDNLEKKGGDDSNPFLY